jgi:alpha-galactosidase
MKKHFRLYLYILFLACTFGAKAQIIIPVETDRISLTYRVGEDGRLYQIRLGERLKHSADLNRLPNIGEAFLTHGMEDYFEPAIRILHNDGNPSLLLKYDSHEVLHPSEGVVETVISLRDDRYPVEVKLHCIASAADDIIRQYTEIVHHEKKAVTLYNYASSLLHLTADQYYLTSFTGDWAHEAGMSESQLDFGKKILDTKLGSRANLFCSPFFLLSLDGKADENAGDILFGTIAWTGNYRFTFEVDQYHKLRILSGINPYASEYSLRPDEIFRTPEFIFTYSTEGKGRASRNFHNWARKSRLKDGEGARLTLLNNWEATYFDFNESKLLTIMDEAVKLGVDMFLLDDGWFANKYPRSSDRQGLGDWDVTADKLPNGIRHLVDEATRRGLKFGLWIEPEMVNPKSELYENHRDWVIHLPNRDEYYFRNQMVLDLSNPQVQEHVFNIVDRLMTDNPGIAYFKWDCNSPITNIYSPYLRDRQSHLYIEHVRGLYSILERIKAKYPALPMMLCSGGGGRSDYAALQYFTDFWPSDNTDAVERIFIQWGFSHFFPAKTLSSHVTSWGKQPVKFKTDVAMMGKLGFDIRINEMSDTEQTFCREAVRCYKRLSPLIAEGDQFRLRSPYESDHAAILYTGKDRSHALLFTFDINPRYRENIQPLRLRGLDPDRNYRLEEINLLPGSRSRLQCHTQTYSGDYLMKYGIHVFSSNQTTSHLIEITEER